MCVHRFFQVHTWGAGCSGSGWFGSAGGQLGHGDLESVKLPKLVESFRNYNAKAKTVACGDKHTLILTDDGEV